MVPSKKQFLQQLINYPELKDNIIAYVFAKNPDIDISQKNSFFDNVKFFYEKYKEQKPNILEHPNNNSDDINEWIGKDLRIKNIKLKSIRGFPESDIPFGIDLLNKENEPQSMVILGGNATGKSSIFDAIEYVFCDEIGEARLRNNTNYKKFLSHFDNGYNNAYCIVETIDHIFDIKKTPGIPETVRKRINPNTHFISDYDIYENGQLDYNKNASKSFHQLIAKSIGLESLLEFHKYIKAFILYRRSTESRAIKSAERNIESHKKIISTTQEAILEKQHLLKSLERKQKIDLKEKDFIVLVGKLQSLKDKNISFSFYSDQIIDLLEIYIEKYNNYIVSKVKSYGIKEIQFLELGLELLSEYEDCPLCLNSNLKPNEIKINVHERINKINEIKKTEQKLQSISNDLIDKLNFILSQFRFLKSSATQEIKELENIVEFNELIQVQIKFESFLSKILSDDFFHEIINLTDNPEYLKDRNKFLHHLFSEHKSFISKLSTIESKINDFIKKRKSIISSIEEKIKSKTQIKSIQEQIIETKKEIKDFEKQIEKAINDIEKETLIKEENENILRLFNEIKESTKEYEKTLKNKLNDIVKSAFAPIKMVVEEVLEEFFKIDNRDLDIIIDMEPDEYDEETGEILSEIITAKIKPTKPNTSPQSVAIVLNTFHYRIFSTMVGVAIAIASRINTKINIPLVLDDIFYASDFENRATIETFLKSLFKIFSIYTPNIPLQLIFFTHDQFIFESAMKAFNELDSNNIIFAKLYPPKEALEGDGYKNIVYKFPNYVANKIYNRMSKTV